MDSPNSGGSKNGRISLSYSTIAIFFTIMAGVAGLYKIGAEIATKDDISSIKAVLTPRLDQHEDRIRSLEIENARHFGASPTNWRLPAHDREDVVLDPAIILAQYPQPMPIPDVSGNQPSARQQPTYVPPPRRAVVPIDMIRDYELQPTRGGAYALLGEDSRFYALDDVLAVMIKILQDRKPAKK